MDKFNNNFYGCFNDIFRGQKLILSIMVTVEIMV
jgi:hypothetical protein